jgi:hypothetical protein
MNDQLPGIPLIPGARRARRANRKPSRAKPGIVLHFLPHEARTMKHNEPGPAGVLGGWGGLENWLVANTDPATLCCGLTEKIQARLLHYLTANYGPGGPNSRVRAACIPALRRAGIEVQAARAPETREPEGASHRPPAR